MGRWDLMVFSGSSKWILDYADVWVWGLFLRQWAEVQIQLSDEEVEMEGRERLR